MDDAIADTVVTALQIADQRAVSDLGEMLAAVATSTRETVAMQLRVNAARARTYRTAQLIAGIVAFFVGLLVLSNRSYMEPFGTVAGQLVLVAVCLVVAAAVWAMVVLSRPAQSERLLRVAHVPPARVRGRPVIIAALLAGMLGGRAVADRPRHGAVAAAVADARR